MSTPYIARPGKPPGIPHKMKCPVCRDEHTATRPLIDCMAAHAGDVEKAISRLRAVGLLNQNDIDDYRNATKPTSLFGFREPPPPAQ